MALTGADAGSIGPVGLKGFRIIADRRLEGANEMISGANKNDYHIAHIDFERDFKPDGYYDLRTIEPNEPCPRCGSPLKISHAIELGHIFKLGTKYADALGATYLDENGKEQPIVMGSYGIGIERIIACHIEQHNDEHGISWDKALAPYGVHVIAATMNHEQSVATAGEIYRKLQESGLEVLFDDRTNVTAGFKFKDADLLGMPLQVVVGERSLREQKVEIKQRRTGERILVGAEEVVQRIRTLLEAK